MLRPIFSYNSQGISTKKFHKKEAKQHAIVYDEVAGPDYDDEEVRKGLATRKSLSARIVPGKTLDPWSRVRFDYVNTVYYHLGVSEVGIITNLDTLNKNLPFRAKSSDSNPSSRNIRLRDP